jgi:hypothetical protein
MKRAIGLFLILMLPQLLYAQQIQNMHQELLKFAKANSPTGNAVLSQCDYDFEKYVHENTIEDLLERFETVVHESVHHLDNKNSSKYRDQNQIKAQCESYYLADGVQISLAMCKVFSSKKLDKLVPDSITDKIFRYPDYVLGKGDLLPPSSKFFGIFGLLEEMNAYYHGTKASFELYEYYKSNRCSGFKDAHAWANYLKNIASHHFAYFEFKLFISWYLQCAKQEYPDVYKKLMAHQKLRVIYTLVDDQYGQLIKDYYVMLHQLVKDLNEAGTVVTFESWKTGTETKLWMPAKSGRKNSRTGYSLFEKDMKILQQLLEGKEHGVLNSFRIEGVTLKNYEEYLK